MRVVEVSTCQQVAEVASWWEASPTDVRPDGMYALPVNPIFAALDSAVILDPASLAALPAKARTRLGAPASNTRSAASSTSGDSFSPALSSTTCTNTLLSAAESSEKTDTATGADTASSTTLTADASQAALAMDVFAAPTAVSSPATAAASGATLGKALVLGVQITIDHNHRINYAGWQSFSSATGSHTLAFAVPFKSWSTYPPQKFDGGLVDATQQVPCDQLVITWLPATAGELKKLTVDGLRELAKAYGIDNAGALSKERLVKRLSKAEMPAEGFRILEAVQQKATEPVTEPQPAAGAVDSVASALFAAGLPVLYGQVQQDASSAQEFSKAQVRSWLVKELRFQCDHHGVPRVDADGKALLKRPCRNCSYPS